MTYDATEQSVQDGAPVELYQFMRGAVSWRYTSAEEDVTFDYFTWTSTPITRGEIEITDEQARSNLELLVPRNLAVADLFRITPPSDGVQLTVYRYHRGDEAASVVLWNGSVRTCLWQNTTTAKLICQPISAAALRTMNPRLQSRGCNHVLYQPRPSCGVAKADHKIDTTVTDITGSTITVAALLSKPYAGGFVERTDGDGNVDTRFIRSFSGLVLTLSVPFQDLAVTDAVTVYPGCDQTPTTCDTVFDNYANFGGLPHLATKNPFGTAPIY